MFTLVENELNALSMALATSWRSTGAQVTHEDCGGLLFDSMVPTETNDHGHGFLFGPVALAKPTIILKIHSTTCGRAGGMHGDRN